MVLNSFGDTFRPTFYGNRHDEVATALHECGERIPCQLLTPVPRGVRRNELENVTFSNVSPPEPNGAERADTRSTPHAGKKKKRRPRRTEREIGVQTTDSLSNGADQRARGSNRAAATPPPETNA